MSRKTANKVCPLCGGSFFNKWAHAEECPGRGRRCESVRLGYGAFPVKKQCVLPWAHNGGHIYE